MLRRVTLALLRRIARRLGFDLRPRRVEPASIVDFEPASDAIYAQSDVRFRVPIGHCFYPFGYGYAADAWHPFTATLIEAADAGAYPYETSLLARYYGAFQPPTLAHLLFPAEALAGADASPLDTVDIGRVEPYLPWFPGVALRGGEHGLDAGHGHQGYGPVSADKGRLELERLLRTYHSVKTDGYRPDLAGDDIRGYFLVRGGHYRFIVRQGLHRIAVLAALGYDSVPVRFMKGFPRAVHAADLGTWPLVRSGAFPEAWARRYVEQFFAPDVRWRARELGLVGASAARPARTSITADEGGDTSS